MSAADDAWQEWMPTQPDTFQLTVEGLRQAAFVAGYRAAIQGVIDALANAQGSWGDGPGGYYGFMVDHVPLNAWLAARAAAVAPRETKD